jgi:hypothetical protein
LLLCLQEFTVIKEDTPLGQLQLYLNGKKLNTNGTLCSEGVKPGDLLYLKQLDDNDANIDDISYADAFVPSKKQSSLSSGGFQGTALFGDGGTLMSEIDLT